MTPSRALQEIAEAACWPLPGCFAGGAISYVKSGKEIPEYLLPGRFIARLPEEQRVALRELTSRAASNVPDWYIKQIVE